MMNDCSLMQSIVIPPLSMLSILLTLILSRDKVMLNTYFVFLYPVFTRVPSYPTCVISRIKISLEICRIWLFLLHLSGQFFF